MPLGIARLNTLGRIIGEGAAPIPTRTPAILTANGNIQVSTAQSKFGGASILGDGTGDFISTPFKEDYDIARTNTWTVECWLRPNTVTGIYGIANCQVYGDSKGWTLYTNGTNVQFLDAASGYTNLVTSGVTLAVNTWYHIAVVRNGSNLDIYVDGISRASTTSYTSKNTTTGPLRIGEGSAISSGLYLDPYSEFRTLNGYMDEFRISNVARYTANFTPSASAFTNDANTVLLIHANDYNGSTTFVDDGGQTIASRTAATLTANGNAQVSTAQSKFGGSSYLGDGSGDFISTPFRLDYDIARSNNFTVECWIRPNTPSSYMGIVNNMTYNTTIGWGVYMASGQINFLDASQNYTNLVTSGITFSANTWYHIALVRSGSNLNIYVDGVSRASINNYTSKNVTSGPLRIGEVIDVQGGGYAQPSSGYQFNGYIDEFRISNVARYTGTFTPSTSAFTNDANTVLLIHANDYNGSTDFIDDNGVNPVFSADSYSSYLKLAVPFDKYYGVKDIAYLIRGSGSTSVRTQGASSTMSSADSYWNTNPAYERSLLNSRDGSALTYNIDGNFPSSTSGTFVVEGWFKPTDNSTNQNWVLSNADANGRWLFGFNTGASSSFQSENNIGFGSSTWQHIAIVCDGGTRRFYKNGIYLGSWYSTDTGFTTLHLGQFNSGDGNDYRGYIQDFRVYVGTNKGYTGTNASAANFTLPTSIIASY